MSKTHKEFDLAHFAPYRLSILSNRISRSIARAYEARFGLTIPQWRCLAVLGQFAPMSAIEVCEKTEMDKVAVSRALARVVEAGLVVRTTDPHDGRRSVLRLSPKGRQVHDEVIPVAQSYEARLLDALSREARAAFEESLDRLLEKACELEAAVPELDDPL